MNRGMEDTRRIFLRAIDGDGRSLADLYERLRPRLVLWVSARLSTRLRALLDAEDAAQEILLAVHRDLDSYRGGADLRSFMAWMFRVAENRIHDLADHHNAKKRQPGRLIVASQTTPGTAAMRSEQLVRVRRAVERLPEDYRRVIRLRRLEEREVEEVAALMDRSPNAVRVLYCRALKALREELEKND